MKSKFYPNERRNHTSNLGPLSTNTTFKFLTFHCNPQFFIKIKLNRNFSTIYRVWTSTQARITILKPASHNTIIQSYSSVIRNGVRFITGQGRNTVSGHVQYEQKAYNRRHNPVRCVCATPGHDL